MVEPASGGTSIINVRTPAGPSCSCYPAPSAAMVVVVALGEKIVAVVAPPGDASGAACVGLLDFADLVTDLFCLFCVSPIEMWIRESGEVR